MLAQKYVLGWGNGPLLKSTQAKMSPIVHARSEGAANWLVMLHTTVKSDPAARLAQPRFMTFLFLGFSPVKWGQCRYEEYMS